MRKIKLEEIMHEVEEDRLCNKCGKSCKCEMNINGLSALVSGAYDSPCLEDYVDYYFDLCEFCLQELFDQFQIPPEIKNYNNG